MLFKQMSIFSSQTSWTGMCSGGNQSPIHLSQSFAKPCKGTCDLKVDDTNITTGGIAVSDEGLVLNASSLGSCKYNNISYNCEMLLINHPSHHTIEKNSQADGEVVAHFRSAQGENLQVCVQFYVNSSPGPSVDFFKQIVPYASNNGLIQLTGWSLQQMIPDDGSFYMYDGSFMIPGCWNAETIVFKSSINIDQTDFALLVNKVQAGSRSIQPLGNREIFYNDGADTGFLPHDNKTYLVMKPLKAPAKKKQEISRVDLKTNLGKTITKEPTTTEKVGKHIYDNWDDYLELLYFLIFSGIVLYTLRYLYYSDIFLMKNIVNVFKPSSASNIPLPSE
jgi:carbonic anhydrase